MSNFAGKQCIWIVGASTGIGRALALLYAQQSASNHIIVSARSEGKLVTLCDEINALGATSIVLPVDISDAGSLNEAEVHLAKFEQGIARIVVNAGTCEYMDSNTPDVAMARRVLETNYFGAIEISRIALPHLRAARDNGQQSSLIFVSSSVTYQALPRAHAYGASKAALRYYAECLRSDLQLENINVQVVSPGFVETPMTAQNDFDMPFVVTSEEAAEKIAKGIERGTFDISFPKGFTWTLKAISLLPTRLRFAVLGKMSRHEPASEDYLKGNTPS